MIRQELVTTEGAKRFVRENITGQKVHTITAFVEKETGVCTTRFDYGNFGAFMVLGFNAGYNGEGPRGLAWCLERFGIKYQPEQIYTDEHVLNDIRYKIYSIGKYPV